MAILLFLLGLLGNSAAMPVSVSFYAGHFLCDLLLHCSGSWQPISAKALHFSLSSRCQCPECLDLAVKVKRYVSHSVLEETCARALPRNSWKGDYWHLVENITFLVKR